MEERGVKSAIGWRIRIVGGWELSGNGFGKRGDDFSS
jgi:hypothetical protein